MRVFKRHLEVVETPPDQIAYRRKRPFRHAVDKMSDMLTQRHLQCILKCSYKKKENKDEETIKEETTIKDENETDDDGSSTALSLLPTQSARSISIPGFSGEKSNAGYYRTTQRDHSTSPVPGFSGNLMCNPQTDQANYGGGLLVQVSKPCPMGVQYVLQNFGPEQNNPLVQSFYQSLNTLKTSRITRLLVVQNAGTVQETRIKSNVFLIVFLVPAYCILVVQSYLSGYKFDLFSQI